MQGAALPLTMRERRQPHSSSERRMTTNARTLLNMFSERASCWSKSMSSYKYHLTALHQRLDERIRREMKNPRPDSIRLLRLKKLRLAVKDKLAALRRRSTAATAQPA